MQPDTFDDSLPPLAQPQRRDGQASRLPTARELQRRSRILAVVRDMVAEHGYERVTMRQIAENSGVVAKTLYNIYGNKETLVGAAINDRLIKIFSEIKIPDDMAGWRRLLHLVDEGVAGMLETPQFTKAMALMLFGDVTALPYIEYFEEERRGAIRQMVDNNDFEPWVDTERLTRLTRFELSAVILLWQHERITNEQLGPYSRLAISQVLLGPAKDSIRGEIEETLKAAHQAITLNEPPGR